MIDHRVQRPIARGALLSVLLITLLSFGNKLTAQDGAKLFQDNCATCHSVVKDLTGPKLQGIEDRVKDKKLLHEWIRNNQKVLASGNKYFNDLFLQWNKTPMNVFPAMTDEEIEAILKYVREYKAPAPKTGDGAPADGKMGSSDNAILYGVLTLILAVVALVMLGVNSNLKKLADDKDGIPAQEPIPFYRNKTYIALITVLLFVIGGFFVTKGMIGLDRRKGYEPVQPIYYSHKVHAGTNQINCLYCHGGAMESKQASIPSVNVCMNCHMSINEYTGDPIYKEDGTEVNGTAEIQKIYAAAGWDPAKKQYTGEEKPVEWVKIHNLPDHVFFSHAQHVKAGKVQCQTCHGEINNMHEVKQVAELSMGWCVNCHRETKVDFVDNKFYSIYEKYHNEIKNKTRDSVTVSDIGGTECQKCHY
ncbi:c-type cytochrome [Pseudobacter ginsenosidimutans]|uniref:Cytochrome c551/c552 n=1 Tax=Pseudobacter ginsenosidimutans TaxID=661488 RepID=A0A4V2F103_9BACT|nr:c-type cytochrome [Pseudobacter ginsenosidimutans]QEC41297.1 c-type cytochrome [Pseudobacter ginsenosidimutans]RZS71931.1 cytochrome c551/c552 [Pseudobacter ginsenosidimutans]